MMHSRHSNLNKIKKCSEKHKCSQLKRKAEIHNYFKSIENEEEIVDNPSTPPLLSPSTTNSKNISEYSEIQNCISVILPSTSLLPSTLSSSKNVEHFPKSKLENQKILVENRNTRSKVWKFFKKDLKNVKTCICILCETVLQSSNNTTNLWTHLKSKHMKQYLKLISNKSSSDETESSEQSSQQQSPVQNNSLSESININNVHKKIKTKQLSLRKLLKRKPQTYGPLHLKKKKIDYALMKLIALDFQPYSIVNDHGFNEFVYTLNDKYVLPSRKHLSEVMIPSFAEQIKKKIKVILDNVNNVSLTCDIWTSIAKHSYLGITVHFLFDKKLRTLMLDIVDISNISHTANDLKDVLSEVIENYNLREKIVCLVTDNANVMLSTVKKIQLKHLGCYAHSLNLVVNAAIKYSANNTSDWLSITDSNMEEINVADIDINFEENFDDINSASEFEIQSAASIIIKCKRITTFFHRSPKNFNLLRRELKERNIDVSSIEQSVSTRWNSVYYMLKKINRIYDSIVVVLSKVDHKLSLLSLTEKKVLPEIIIFLAPFEEVTTKISAESYPSVSLIIPYTTGIIKALQELEKPQEINVSTIEGKRFLKLLLHFTKVKLLPYEKNTVCAKATILDPRIKSYGFSDYSNYTIFSSFIQNEIRNEIQSEIDKKVANLKVNEINNCNQISDLTVKKKKSILGFVKESQPHSNIINLSNSRSEAIIQLNNYINDVCLDENDDIINYWEEKKLIWKHLSQIAEKYLSVPGTSVPSERLFSSAGYTISDRRNRLNPSKLYDLLIINKNYWLLDI